MVSAASPISSMTQHGRWRSSTSTARSQWQTKVCFQMLIKTVCKCPVSTKYFLVRWFVVIIETNLQMELVHVTICEDYNFSFSTAALRHIWLFGNNRATVTVSIKGFYLCFVSQIGTLKEGMHTFPFKFLIPGRWSWWDIFACVYFPLFISQSVRHVLACCEDGTGFLFLPKC